MKQKLSDSAREARNAYYREYRRKHKEQIQETNRAYWERVAATRGEEAHAVEIEINQLPNG